MGRRTLSSVVCKYVNRASVTVITVWKNANYALTKNLDEILVNETFRWVGANIESARIKITSIANVKISQYTLLIYN